MPRRWHGDGNDMAMTKHVNWLQCASGNKLYLLLPFSYPVQRGRKHTIAHIACRYDNADCAYRFSGFMSQQCVLHSTRPDGTSRASRKAVANQARSRSALSAITAKNYRLPNQGQLQKWFLIQFSRSLPFRQQIAVSLMILEPFFSTSSIGLTHASYI